MHSIQFRKILDSIQPSTKPAKTWLFTPYDQLSDKIGPLSRETPNSLGIILIDSSWRWARRPYHKHRIAFSIANLRWFAIEQARRGVAVRYIETELPFRKVLYRIASQLGPLRVMEPAERELRSEIEPLVRSGRLELIPHEGWLTSRKWFDIASRGAVWRMNAFYRFVRRKTEILMDKGKPISGKYSFDKENRLSWKGSPPSPSPPSFPMDVIKDEVIALVNERYARHPGGIAAESLPATLSDAELLWSWAKRECLANFGPYEDAMSLVSSGLFHTRISSLLNIHRIVPAQIIEDVLDLDIPIASKEGFIRQILGWREYVYHVHRTTDGFRSCPAGEQTLLNSPGTGGYENWSGHQWTAPLFDGDPDGGAAPNYLNSQNPLPPAFWGAESGLFCLDTVVESVWKESWSHHITRLMVLSNIASLLDVNPRELTDWFWVAYADAYDWVVEPNVLGMGTYAVGNLMTTKPYIAGSAYINRMSDFCRECKFDPVSSCPITNLYWAFLERHKNALRNNPRMLTVYAALSKRPDSLKVVDRQVYEKVLSKLCSGQPVE